MNVRTKARYKMIAFLSSMAMVIGLWASPEAALQAKAEASEDRVTASVEAALTEETLATTSLAEGLVGPDAAEDDGTVAQIAGGSYDYNAANQVLSILNQERANAGLAPLVMDPVLLDAAMLRAQEISDYFSHTRPDGRSCYTAAPDGKMSGENIAMGYRSPGEVMAGWMGSPGHRENILRPEFSTVGIGCYYVGGRYYWTQCFGYSPLVSHGIYVETEGRLVGAGLMLASPYENPRVEYRWIACNANGGDWFEVQAWSEDAQIIIWYPDAGNYVLVAQARIVGDPSSQVESSVTVSAHDYIKGKCQMPYDGPGGGYLIGFETFKNPNQSYRYEMLILDCTLLSQGKDAWIYTTNQCYVSEGNAFWTIWQPQYGYYWTLFRVYDKNGNLLEEDCYGFQNI